MPVVLTAKRLQTVTRYPGRYHGRIESVTRVRNYLVELSVDIKSVAYLLGADNEDTSTLIDF